jgi:phosphoribosyl 1,2-cyclic phosphodiesterase
VHATVWGCRGSLATPGPETVRYGGNTSCLEVRLDDGTLLILDAGTGIRPLGLQLLGRGEPLHLLLTHLHLDHLEGLGFFLPIWDRQSHVHIWGPASHLRSLEERIARYLSPPLFPIDLSHIPAQLTFHDVVDEPWEIGGATIEAWPVMHPGPTVGYRIDADGGVLAYIPDHEPALGGVDGHASEWVSGVAVALGADVLLHDGQYFEEEYAERVGWGHSSFADAVAFAQLTAVERLILFHHDPLHTDEDLDELGACSLELWSGEGPGPELAREQMTIELAPRRSGLSQVRP